MNESMTISLKDAKALERAEIITVMGVSGAPASVEIATKCPACCEVHSSAGDTYDVSYADGFLTLVKR